MNYKKPGFWLAIAMAAALAILGAVLLLNPAGEPSSNEGADKVTVPKGLQLYLVKESDTSNITHDVNIDDLALESQPLLSGADIVSYNWDMHCLKIKNNGMINRELLRRSFVMTADGERIYSGAFWSAIFSMLPPKIPIFLNNLDIESSYIILPLAGWRPGVEIPADAQNILEDIRIKKVLERDSKMYKAYIPKNFDRPDYIGICEKGSQYGFGDFDWEEKDNLLRLLDVRFTESLEFQKLEFNAEKNASLYQNEIIVLLGYNELHEQEYTISGEARKISLREIIMPVTGDYCNLMLFKGDNDYILSPVGKLKSFEDIDLLKSALPQKEQVSTPEPEGIYLAYNKGEAFEYIKYSVYELDSEEAVRVKENTASGKALKKCPASNPKIMSLTLKFGKNDDRWFHACDDGETLFSEGKYYKNPALAKTILEIAKDKCGFTIFNPNDFKGITSAKYSFRTHTRTIERIVTDKATLAKIEEGLQKSLHDMGGGCPFSDGVLTLSFSNGKNIEISMASDDCPLMFVNNSYLKYTDELHKLLIDSFDNFPYVRDYR